MKKTAKSAAQPRYTRAVLLQMFAVLCLLGALLFWQWEGVYQIYLTNQINALGWALNGSIVALFLCGLAALVKRFFEYRGEEVNLFRFARNVRAKQEPLRGVAQTCLVAERYRILQELHQRGASINQNALAATLLAMESSRNSFLKFVHNALILTGVFGTIVSLSFSLLGASDIIHGGGQASGFGAMLFGMSTALSTTMTAILAYLIFGYFYIKLTDTQTYLISQVEQVTAISLLPHLQRDANTMAKDYSASVRNAAQLIAQFSQSQQHYENSVESLRAAAQSLSGQLKLSAQHHAEALSKQELMDMLNRLSELQQQATAENRRLLTEVIHLLQQGFRLRKQAPE